ncbi:molybdopterin-dependent oxidoreductase [Pseudodesulfovibrio sp. JC047]|uniref:molybdopterin-containing oxidoreductase family protein n=1 Tax=Pseudodesulfovibrio sp. JC047 TaxID=2683199 RepID=UPI0013D80610|nr:molybdopterin-dependent oxidoreductase [Pseudodesulfovibrio sp. JC047]NDV18304.1 molybdopterin-dependent oxidoreductase [Pseudodesulfovibrio sp. JC047]
MKKEYVKSICGMCTVRCPIEVEVVDGKVEYIQGNPDASGIEGSLCARGAAGTALTYEEERPQYPMVRTGKRGEGKWKQVSWDEALDYVADELKRIQETYGKDSVMFSDRGGPFRDFYRAFLRGIGTSNYNNHDSACARNVQNAALSVFGFGRKGVSYDLKNAKHVILQQRNIFEAVNVAEVNNLLNSMSKGCKLSVIDIRANVPATKADNFFMIRPGTDYGFNLAVINVIINEKLYDKDFVGNWVEDFDLLKDFVQQYTPEWAEEETGIKADDIRDFCHQLAEAAPSILWHPGWMTARYTDSFYMSRTIYIINALMGAIGAKGGLPFMNKPGDVGAKGLNSFMNLYPKPEGKRADGVGWMDGRKHLDAGPGLVHLSYEAAVEEKPYPVKAYICNRHDPLMAFPDAPDIRKMWDSIELLVSATFTWSDTAWYADVVLPISPYLERDDTIMTKNGPKPAFQIRKRAVQPVYDTKAIWEIYSGLAKRFGLEELVYENVEDIWNFQLDGTGVSLSDFDATGIVPLADGPLYKPVKEGSFKTPSGKVQIIDAKLEADGLKSLKPYESPERPPEGKFRITFGRCALHTQGHTLNNKLLFERMSENVLWINTKRAEELGIENDEYVTVSSIDYSSKIRAFVTDFVHPECIFMLHGFDHKLKVESRAIGRGAADNLLLSKGIKKWDRGGGAVAMQEHFVTVSK